MAVLGEMEELGPDAAAYHREVGAHARNLGVEPLIGVGELARDYAPDAWAPDAEAAIPLAEAMLAGGRRGAGQGLALGRPRAPDRRALVASRGGS